MITINNLKEATQNKYNILIDRFMETNLAINDHNGRRDRVSGLVFFFLTDDEEREIVPCGYYDTSYFSLNPVFVDKNNMLRISTWAAAGSLVSQRDVQKTIDKYNHDYNYQIDKYGLDFLKYNKISYVLMADGTIYEPEEK